MIFFFVRFILWELLERDGCFDQFVKDTTELQVAGLLSLVSFSREFQGPPGCINYFDIHAPCVCRVGSADPPQLIKIAPPAFGSNMITKHQQLHSTLKKFKKSCKNKICALSNCKLTLSQRIKSVGFKNFASQHRAIHSIRKYSKLSMILSIIALFLKNLQHQHTVNWLASKEYIYQRRTISLSLRVS